MQNRFGESALILYHNADEPEVREEHAEVIERIERQGLLYPVTVIDGEPVYDGAVSYPTILSAVQRKLEAAAS